MNLPEGVRVANYREVVNFRDGSHGGVGSVRCGPDVVREATFDYPQDVLAMDRIPFKSQRYHSVTGIVCHEIEDGPWEVVWLTVAKDCIDGIETERYDGFVYSPELGVIRAIESVENDDSRNKWHCYDVESWSLIDTYSRYQLMYVEVPDEILIDILKHDYDADLTAQVI